MVRNNDPYPRRITWLGFFGHYNGIIHSFFVQAVKGQLFFAKRLYRFLFNNHRFRLAKIPTMS